MPPLIEMLAKKSPLGAFLFAKLTSSSYPAHLIWETEEQLTFQLICICKNKKGWTPEVERIFSDYILFTNNKSKANGQGKRAVLLQAFKKSPYIKIDDRSTTDQKFCSFTKKFVSLLSRSMQAINQQTDTTPVEMGRALPETRPAEDTRESFCTDDGFSRSGQSTSSSTHNDGEHLCEAKSSIINGEGFGAFPSYYDPLEEFLHSLNPLNLPYGMQSHMHLSFQDDTDQSMQAVSEPTSTVPMQVALPETNRIVPAEDQSLYAEEGLPSSGQSRNPSTSNSGGLLNETEQSMSFLTRVESWSPFGQVALSETGRTVPSEDQSLCTEGGLTSSGQSRNPLSSNGVSHRSAYNPLEDLVSPQHSLDLKNVESLADKRFVIQSISSVSLVGSQVQILEQVALNSPLPRSDYFLMTVTGASATDQ